MIKKYIIKNCPCFNEGNPMLDYYGECLDLTSNIQLCQDCTDCVMKQIVLICRDNAKYGDGFYTSPILELLDIKEVE